MTADIDQLIVHLETHLARVEARLIAVVNERTTRMIDATTAVIGGLHEEIQATTAALGELSANIVERLDDQERRIAALADLVTGGAEVLDIPPLRDTVAALAARVAAVEARPPAAPRWVIGMIALLALADAAQFAVCVTLVWRLL